jgi:hypothetical protein
LCCASTGSRVRGLPGRGASRQGRPPQRRRLAAQARWHGAGRQVAQARAVAWLLRSSLLAVSDLVLSLVADVGCHPAEGGWCCLLCEAGRSLISCHDSLVNAGRARQRAGLAWLVRALRPACVVCTIFGSGAQFLVFTPAAHILYVLSTPPLHVSSTGLPTKEPSTSFRSLGTTWVTAAGKLKPFAKKVGPARVQPNRQSPPAMHTIHLNDLSIIADSSPRDSEQHW